MTSGCAASHFASKEHDVDHMRLLIEHGAIVDLRNGMGRTPLHICVAPGPREDVAVDAARLLLESGANANNRDNKGKSILWTACFHQKNTVVRLLLQNGATVNDKDALSGERLLHKLATPRKSLEHHAKTMEVLLEHGANPRIQDNQGKLPLDVACADVWGVRHSERDTENMNVIYVLFQRMIGDASLSFKKQK